MKREAAVRRQKRHAASLAHMPTAKTSSARPTSARSVARQRPASSRHSTARPNTPHTTNMSWNQKQKLVVSLACSFCSVQFLELSIISRCTQGVISGIETAAAAVVVAA